MRKIVHSFLSRERTILGTLFFLMTLFWLLLIFYFDGLVGLQLLAALLLVTTYFFWGVGSHYFDKTLHLKNVLEYLLISFIGFLIIAFLLI